MIPAPAEGRRGWRHPAALITLAFCALWIAFVATHATGDRGQWVAVDLPVIAESESSSLLSFSEIVDGYAIHRENLPTFRGVAMFEGAAVSGSFYHIRALYNFVASLLTPFLGFVPSFLVLNLAAWGTMTYLSWRLARSLSGNAVAGALSAALTVGSLGFVVHVSDFSAHLWAATTYFGGIVAIHEADIWSRRRRLAIHLALGVYLAIAVITYNTGVILCLVYVLVAWRRNTKWHIALALAIGLSAFQIWSKLLDLVATGKAPDVEAGQLAAAKGRWLALLDGSPVDVVVAAARFVTENVTVDMPLIVPLGLVAILAAPGLAGRRLFLLFAVLVPIALLLPWRIVSTGTVAYTIFGMVPVLHAAIADWLAGTLERRSRRWMAALAAVLLLAQLGWSTGPLRGWMLPLQAYFWGPYEMGKLWTAQPTVESLTGQEPTPHLFGGRADLVDAGLARNESDILDTGFNPFAGLVTKAFPAALIIALILLLLPPGRRRNWSIGGFGALVVCSSLAAPITRIMPPSYTLRGWTAIHLKAGERLTYRIQVSPGFGGRLATVSQNAETALYVGVLDGLCDVDVFVNGLAIPTTGVHSYPSHGELIELDRAVLAGALALGGELQVTFRPSASVTINGWQRAGLPGRAIDLPSPLLPLVELRVLAPDRSLVLAGF